MVVCQVVSCKPEKATDKVAMVLTFDIQLANPVPDSLSVSALRKAFSSVNVGEIVSGVVSHTGMLHPSLHLLRQQFVRERDSNLFRNQM